MKDNFIGNKLKEISEEYESWCRNIALDALCGKYDYIKSEDWWKEKIKQSLTDYHNHIVEKIDKSIDDWKEDVGEIPENTCPKIDNLIGQHKEILNDLNYLEKNKHKYETVDDIVKDFPGTYWDNVESIAEELRVSNQKLREIGKFWYENCKSILSLLQDTNINN